MRVLSFAKIRNSLRMALTGPQLLAFLPAMTLAAFWLGGEKALLMFALIMPIAFAIAGLYEKPYARSALELRDAVTGLGLREGLVERIDDLLAKAQHEERTTAALVLEIDDFDDLKERYGQSASDEILLAVGNRLSCAVRGTDFIARLDGPVFGISLTATGSLDLENLIQVSARLQGMVADPIALDRSNIYVTSSIGFCLSSRASEKSAEGLLSAAHTALDEARASGQGAIRSYSADMLRSVATRNASIEAAAKALESGQIVPWFQPQISTDTGAIVGFECLARWSHPERGQIPPREFIPLLEQGGHSERLSEVILYHGLTALREWRRAGFDIPTIGVNFSTEELRNPRLAERIRWELDRFELDPAALNVEILETVMVATEDDVIFKNVRELSAMGCKIDLDDFGTGNTSITNIRRFAVSRIKIDRSFVTRVDQDREQQSMVSAILTMAERLGVDALAEGVETVGEHAMLAQLGCTSVQGFAIARPMPVEETIDWMQKHQGKLAQTPKIGRQTG